MRTLLILAALASLSACGFGSDPEPRSDRSSSRADRADKGDRSSRDDRDRGEVDPELEEELATEARAARRDLPRSVGNGATLEDIEARDNELTFSFRTTFPVDEDRVDAMRTAERTNMCEQPQTRDWFRRGAVLNYRITDSNDEERRFSYDSCPAER